MTDIQDLKAIAERCKGHQPLRFMQSYGALYIRNDNGVVFDVHQNRSFPDFMAQNKDYADLVLAANPAAVLDLFAEIDSLKSRLEMESAELAWSDSDGRAIQAERDQLKAESEAQRKDAERWRFFSVLANELQAFPHSWGQMTPEKMNFMCDQAMADAAMSKEASHD